VGTTVLLAGCSARDWETKLKFGWPTGVTKQADRMRTLWTWSSVTALIVGAITWGLIFWACARYRKKDDVLPKQMKYHLPIEIAYTIAPFLVIAGLFYYTAVVETYVDKLSAKPDTIVQVNAFKWNWQFEYPAKTYAGTNPNYKDHAVSTVGSQNEIPVLVLPRGQRVQIIEASVDVVHSFWVPDFLFKRDVIPYGNGDEGTKADEQSGLPEVPASGLPNPTSLSRTKSVHNNRFEITATSNGHFVGHCAELCGTYHSQMNFEVRVVDPAQYTKYLDALVVIGPTDPARQSKALRAIGDDAYATTTHPFNTDRSARSGSN
jgi:cytochrome c oxidase subunit 2